VESILRAGMICRRYLADELAGVCAHVLNHWLNFIYVVNNL